MMNKCIKNTATEMEVKASKEVKKDSNSSNHEFNESDLSSNNEIGVKLDKFQCDHQELKHDISFLNYFNILYYYTWIKIAGWSLAQEQRYNYDILKHNTTVARSEKLGDEKHLDKVEIV